MGIPGVWGSCLRQEGGRTYNQFPKKTYFVDYMYDIDIEHYSSFEPNVSELDKLQWILRCF